MALAARHCTMGRPARHAAARPPRLAPVAAAPRPPLRQGAAHRRRLAPRRRPRAGLQALLLLPRRPGAPGRLRGVAAAAPRRRRRRPRRTHPARPRRHADQALRAARRGGRRPPQPQPRPRRPEVPLRAHLGDHRLAGLPPALGRHRPALARPALRPGQGRRPADDPLRGPLPHQVGDGRGIGRLGRRLVALPGKVL